MNLIKSLILVSSMLFYNHSLPQSDQTNYAMEDYKVYSVVIDTSTFTNLGSEKVA